MSERPVIVARAGLFDVGFDEETLFRYIGRAGSIPSRFLSTPASRSPSSSMRTSYVSSTCAKTTVKSRKRCNAGRLHRQRNRTLGDSDISAHGHARAPRAVRIGQQRPRDDGLARRIRQREYPLQRGLDGLAAGSGVDSHFLPALQSARIGTKGVQLEPQFRQVSDFKQRLAASHVADVGVARKHDAVDGRGDCEAPEAVAVFNDRERLTGAHGVAELHRDRLHGARESARARRRTGRH